VVLCLLPAIEYFRADMAATYTDRTQFLGIEGANAFDRLHGSEGPAGFSPNLYRQPALHQPPLYSERPTGPAATELSESDPMLALEAARI